MGTVARRRSNHARLFQLTSYGRQATHFDMVTTVPSWSRSDSQQAAIGRATLARKVLLDKHLITALIVRIVTDCVHDRK